MNGVVPEWQDGLKLSRVRRAALVAITRDLERERVERLIGAIMKGVGG